MEVKEEGSKEEETDVEDDNSVKEREEEDTKKEGDFFRRCRVRVIGLRSGKGSFAKRLFSFVSCRTKQNRSVRCFISSKGFAVQFKKR